MHLVWTECTLERAFGVRRCTLEHSLQRFGGVQLRYDMIFIRRASMIGQFQFRLYQILQYLTKSIRNRKRNGTELTGCGWIRLFGSNFF